MSEGEAEISGGIMNPCTRVSRILMAICIVASAGAMPLEGQAARPNSAPDPGPACALVTVAEVRKATSNNDYPDPPIGGSMAETGSKRDGWWCQYGGASMRPGPEPPAISIALFPGSSEAARARSLKQPADCRSENVRGVGNDALYVECPKGGPTLFVTQGSSGFRVDMQLKGTPDPAIRAALIAIAKVAASRVKGPSREPT